jgi:hypothetical protein
MPPANQKKSSFRTGFWERFYDFCQISTFLPLIEARVQALKEVIRSEGGGCPGVTITGANSKQNIYHLLF